MAPRAGDETGPAASAWSRLIHSPPVRVAGRALGGLWLGWLLLSGAFFVYSGVAGSTWPSSWRAPWSDQTDFVVLQDGRLAVYISAFDRLELYSPRGAFEGSWKRVKGYLGGEARLSLAPDGRLFVTASHGRLRSYAPSGALLRRWTGERSSRAWRLSPEGEAVAEHQAGAREPTRAVRPGEILIAGHPAPRRKVFEGGGGLRATRSGSGIVLRRRGAEPVFVATPWYLLPVKIPWPGCVPLLPLLLVAAVDQLRRRKRAA